MSDPITPERLRHYAEVLGGTGWPDVVEVLRQAADRLEQLTAAKEVPEGSVTLRYAVAFDGRNHAIYGTQKRNADSDEQLMQWAHEDLSGVTHQAVFTVVVPPAVVPEIVAQIESVER